MRALRAEAIKCLAWAEDGAARLEPLFEKAGSMTERLAALRALCSFHGAPERETALARFYADWKDNDLVIDKWFAQQAASADAKAVRALMEHDDFSLNNPNRVRSVLGVFASQSLAAFHDPSGEGHALLAETARKVDALNPALAARLLTLFDQWRRLEPIAHASAKAALSELKTADLSKNSGDIVERTLG